MQTYTGIPPFAPPDHPATAATVPRRNRHLAPVVLACVVAALLLAAHRNARPGRTDGTLASEKGAAGAGNGAEVTRAFSAWNLTPRQCEVARLILERHDYRDIGRLCGVSLRTVQDDASHIFRAAAVKGRRDFERLMASEAPKGPASPGHP